MDEEDSPIEREYKEKCIPKIKEINKLLHDLVFKESFYNIQMRYAGQSESDNEYKKKYHALFPLWNTFREIYHNELGLIFANNHWYDKD